MNTLEGSAWKEAFLAGDAGTADFLEPSREIFQQWIDCGMVNAEYQDLDAGDMIDHYTKGNTAFWLGGNIRFSQNADGTGDQYGLMPYLSEDGTRNVYITQVSRSYGLNKELENAGNEQKLEDALHVLEVLSTTEGYNSLSGYVSSSMCSIKGFTVEEDSPYKDAVEMINNGHSANLLYAGWEDYVVDFGEAVRAWISGEQTGSEAIAVLDETQHSLKENGEVYYGEVTEQLDTRQGAQLCGQIFMKAADTDAALISYNVYYDEVLSEQENGYGVNGYILTGKLTDEDITSFLPSGWYGTLTTSRLSGAKIKQMAEDGYDKNENGYPYPYVLLTKDGKPLEEEREYSVIICGVPKGLEVEDTGILGLDAAKEYLKNAGEISSATLDDSLLQQLP